MVDGNYLDRLESVARGVRQSPRPWGGIQIVITGDFLQLPPVSTKDGPEIKFCFEAQCWSKSIHQTILLDTVYRQAEDEEFANMLNEIREGKCSSSTAEKVIELTSNASKCRPGVARLFSLRRDVEAINLAQLQALEGRPFEFQAVDQLYDKDFKIDSTCPARKSITLKVGCQVILLKTLSIEEKLVNGSVGTLVRFTANPCMPVVRFDLADKEVSLPPEEWVFKSGGKEVARRRQVPLELAWGVSIHKSQGMTLQRCEISLDGIFECAQTYVAMSRCQSLDGLSFVSNNANKGHISRLIRANPKCLAFYQAIKENLGLSS